MEVYFQQAKNVEAERRACEIRLRAERKAGQLLAKMEKNKGRAAPTRSRGTTTLKELGISKDQSSRWQALAGVPEEEFEAALGGEEKPTTSGIIAKPPKMPETSLWLWGRLRDFERDGLLEMNSMEATELMTDAMVADVKRLAPCTARGASPAKNFSSEIFEPAPTRARSDHHQIIRTTMGLIFPLVPPDPPLDTRP